MTTDRPSLRPPNPLLNLRPLPRDQYTNVLWLGHFPQKAYMEWLAVTTCERGSSLSSMVCLSEAKGLSCGGSSMSTPSPSCWPCVVRTTRSRHEMKEKGKERKRECPPHLAVLLLGDGLQRRDVPLQVVRAVCRAQDGLARLQQQAQSRVPARRQRWRPAAGVEQHKHVRPLQQLHALWVRVEQVVVRLKARHELYRRLSPGRRVFPADGLRLLVPLAQTRAHHADLNIEKCGGICVKRFSPPSQWQRRL